MKKVFFTLLLLVGFAIFSPVNASTLTETLPNANSIEMTQLNQADDPIIVTVTITTEYGVYDEGGNHVATITFTETYTFTISE